MKFDYIFGEDVAFMYPNVTIHIERIYPSTAKEMLKTNTHNRDKYRNALRKVIEQGLWKLNGATIVWSDESSRRGTPI